MADRAPERLGTAPAPGRRPRGASRKWYHQASQEPTTGHPPNGRTLLPPLPASRAERALLAARSGKDRTTQACDQCRKSKAKCSGDKPCDKCVFERKECIYAVRRKDMELQKRDMERKETEKLQRLNEKLSQRNEQLVSALLIFASDLGPNIRRELEELAMSHSSETDEAEAEDPNYFDPEMIEYDKQKSSIGGEENISADIGSPGALDVIDEDTNRDEHTRAAGFMGKSSAVTWVQRAKKAAVHDFEEERHLQNSSGTAASGPFTDATYHAEPRDIPTIRTEEVNAIEWPSPAIARALVDAYFDNVHVSLPMLSRSDFYRVFETFPKDRISREDQTWLAVANMIFAIGAKFAHITNAHFKGDDRDHLVYYARARALGMDQRTLNEDPELLHTTCLGILGLYLLSTDQLNRAWTVNGIAVRHAMALGLHVRTEAKDLSDMDKELRVRLWWSFYCLERLLAELTGRPSCIADNAISTPLPLNVDESEFRRDSPLYDKKSIQSSTSPKMKGNPLSAQQIPTPITSSSASIEPSVISVSSTSSPVQYAYTLPISRSPITSSTYFIYQIQLSIISHKILTKLYCATLVKSRWSKVQDSIRDIDSKILNWKTTLPDEFDFSLPSTATDAFALQKTGLSMFYYSSRMTLFRPCLCRFDGRIENESKRSKAFDSNCAISCVESARNLLASLPANYDPSTVYTVTPWWNVVHFIVEAGSILMLELAYRAEHLPSQAEEILADSKKAVLWLRAMSSRSIAARKSWEIFHSLLQVVAPKIGCDTADMPRTAPVPPGWRWNRFGTQDKQGSDQEQQDQLSSHTEKPNPLLPTPMDEWVNHSSFDNEQLQHSAPIFTNPISVSNPSNGMVPNFLMGLYPFNEVYGRYDEFGPLNMQNPYLPDSAMQGEGTYPDVTVHAGQGGIGGGLPGQLRLMPQLVTMEQVQLGSETGGYAEGGDFYDSGTKVPGNNFLMADYRG